MRPLDRYTTPLGFSSLFAFCGLPLRVDPYKGCAFGCSYCFARARESVGGTPHVRPADAKMLERQFKRALVDDRDDLSVIGECIKQRVPLQLGAMGDPFQPAEQRYGVSLEYLRSALKFQYPVVISTRSSLVAEAPYVDILRSLPAVVVRMSLSTIDDRRATLIENDSVRPSRILKTMELLASAGIRIACRWQPFVPGFSDSLDAFANTVASAGAQQCSFEFLRLPRESNSRLTRAYKLVTGAEISMLYKNAGAKHRVREYILPAEERLPVITQARSSIHAAGMRFGSADNDFQYLSDSACCCSGVGLLPGFENFFKHQIAYAIRQCFDRDEITYDSIEGEWKPEGSIDRYLNSGRRISSRTGGMGSVREHIKRRWNSTGQEGSPDSFAGVERTDRFSAGEMRIYRWSRSFRLQLAKYLQGQPLTPRVPS